MPPRTHRQRSEAVGFHPGVEVDRVACMYVRMQSPDPTIKVNVVVDFDFHEWGINRAPKVNSVGNVYFHYRFGVVVVAHNGTKCTLKVATHESQGAESTAPTNGPGAPLT